MCARWMECFDNFLKDMGPAPSPEHSIDRFPDKKGDYEPNNCRWATRVQQANNTSRNKELTHNGVTKTMAEWATSLGISYYALRKRLHDGINLTTSLTTPIGKLVEIKPPIQRKKKGGSRSPYIGVVWSSQSKKWVAVYSRKGAGIKKHIGYYHTEREAAMAFIEFYKNKFGEPPYAL